MVSIVHSGVGFCNLFLSIFVKPKFSSKCFIRFTTALFRARGSNYCKVVRVRNCSNWHKAYSVFRLPSRTATQTFQLRHHGGQWVCALLFSLLFFLLSHFILNKVIIWSSLGKVLINIISTYCVSIWQKNAACRLLTGADFVRPVCLSWKIQKNDTQKHFVYKNLV